MSLFRNLPPTIDYSTLPATVDPGVRTGAAADRAVLSKGMSVRGRNGEQYLILGRLGEPGAQADVYEARKHNMDYVLKVYHGGFDPCDAAMDVIERNECPHVARLIERGMYDGVYYFEVYPRYSSGTLADWIERGKCTGSFITRVLLPNLDQALSYLHEHGLVHGDVKPANIFIVEGGSAVVLGDFGVASVLPTGKRTVAFRGTLEYAPPVRHEGNQVAISPAYDYGALGLVLLECYAGRSPFAGKTLDERDEAWLTFDVGRFTQIPSEAAVLIEGLLDRHESARFGHEQCKAFYTRQTQSRNRGFYGRDRGHRSAVERSAAPTLELGMVGGRMSIARSMEDLLKFCEQHWSSALPLLTGGETGKLGRFLRRATNSEEFYGRWVGRFADEADDARMFMLCAALRERCEGRASHGMVFGKSRYRNIVHLLESVRNGSAPDAKALLYGECLPEYLSLFGYGSDVANQVRDVVSGNDAPEVKAALILAFCTETPELEVNGTRIGTVAELLALVMRLDMEGVERLIENPALASWLYVHNCPIVLKELESFNE